MVAHAAKFVDSLCFFSLNLIRLVPSAPGNQLETRSPREEGRVVSAVLGGSQSLESLFQCCTVSTPYACIPALSRRAYTHALAEAAAFAAKASQVAALAEGAATPNLSIFKEKKFPPPCKTSKTLDPAGESSMLSSLAS